MSALRLLLALIRDREGDLVRLDARVKNLVLKQRRRFRIEEDTRSLFFDHLVVLARQRTTLSWKFVCVPASSATKRRPPVSRVSSDEEKISCTA
jgi:hypothetical protein